jgi:hypothetical protein
MEANVAEMSRQLGPATWLDGVLIEDVPLVNGTNVINHRLGRRIRGWLLMRPRGAAAFSYPVETASDNKTLTLAFGASATADVWVY